MEPARIGLQKVVREMLQNVAPEEAVLVAWPAACGIAVSERTSPLQFADGVLTVQVADAGWRTNLADFAPQYKQTLRQLTGAEVSEIRFVVKGSG